MVGSDPGQKPKVGKPGVLKPCFSPDSGKPCLPARLSLLLLAFFFLPSSALARETSEDSGFPAAEFFRLITLQDYNTRVVLLGTTLLGLAAGMAGTFLLLRKRSLLCDAVSHATLPGVVGAFIIMALLGGTGKSLPALLAGAAVTGVIGMLCVLGIQKWTRLKADAALAIVLGVFFGMGLALLGVATRLGKGQAAGLQSFIYGKTASMLMSDMLMIAGIALAAALICVFFFKEFKMVCFDASYAQSQGWPVLRIDLLIMLLIVTMTVVGLQAVGLILVVALLITPPAAARFWSNDLAWMTGIAALIGALSGLIGSALSAVYQDMPAGAVIVLTASALFFASLVFGPAKGIVPRGWRHRSLGRRVGHQHLLRALYELSEKEGDMAAGHPFDRVLMKRSWSPRRLRGHIRRAEKGEYVYRDSQGRIALTELGESAARKIIRNHRLWEMYLIAHADIAPSHVDRDADSIEHVLDDAMIERLEAMLFQPDAVGAVPADPHAEPT